jgi:hypothetical protein
MRRRGAGALGRSVAVGLLLWMTQVLEANAQIVDAGTPPQRRGAPAVVRVGKWASLAGSALFGLAAYNAHQDAEASYDALRDRCRAVTFSCLLDANNTYVDPVSERLYTDSRDADRRAARYLIGSEVLFVATAAGFIWELTHREERPENIPYLPRVTQSRSETRVSWSLSF